MMDIVVTGAGLATVAAYVWSLRQHFEAGKMPPGARIVSGAVALSTVFYVYLTFAFEQPLWAQWAGLVLQVAAGALFAATIAASRAARLEYAFTPQTPRGLVQTGPYGRIRHPFYTSYIIFWSGWALATWSLPALLSLSALIALYVLAALGEEQKFAQSPLAESYAAYKRRTGFFWPKLI